MKLPLKRKNNSGFTLIEILVGLTIIGLLFGFGFVSFRDFSRRQALYGTVRNLKGDLRLAQETALAGKKPANSNCNSPNTLSGYNYTSVSDSEYRIEAVCSGGLVVVKTVALPSDVAISPPSPNPVRFNVLGNGTNVAPGADALITLTQDGTGSQTTVKITSSGEIQ